jgi:hypothetical protein
MFARANAHHHQIAYVTNDLDRAVALFERDYGAPGFFVFSNVGTGAATPGGPELRIALSHVGGVEIELIEPLGDTAPLFKDPLAEGPALDVRFHHVAIRIGGPVENWEAHAASIDTAAHPIVFHGRMGEDLRFFYTDERSRIGHYVEHVWMSETLLGQLRAAIPQYPAKVEAA